MHMPGESSRTIRDLAAPRGVQYLMSATQFRTNNTNPDPDPNSSPSPNVS